MRNTRPATLIKMNKNTTTPQNVMYLDVETYVNKTPEGQDLPFRLAVTWHVHYNRDRKITTQQRKTWNNPRELCEYISARAYEKQKLYIFTHNVTFDGVASNLFEYLCKDDWVEKFKHNKGLNFILAVKKEKASIIFVSSTNFFPWKLSVVGEMLGLSKLDIDFHTEDTALLTEYCQRDVEILKTAVEAHFDFIRMHDLGNFKPTLPGQALAAFRHRFMRHKIYPTQLKEVKVRERLSYHGGRVECFQIGKFTDGPYVKLDVNSQYPYVMRNNSFPTAWKCCMYDIDVAYLAYTLESWCVCAEVVINTDVPMYAVKSNTKLFFPVGEFTTTITTPLLLEAIKRGHLVKVIKADCYKSARIFTDYVDFFFCLKEKYSKNENKVLREMTKKFLNTLYGKFAQENDITVDRVELGGEVCRSRRVFYEDGSTPHTETKFFNKWTIPVGKKEPAHTSTVISSHVTEYARLYLWKLIEKVGVDKVLYCDTDCIICAESDIEPVKEQLDPYKLGFLDIEKRGAACEIRAPKDYTLGDEVKRKGVPKSAKLIRPNVFEYQQFLGLKSYINSGDISHARTKTIVKTLAPNNNKRIFNLDGTSSPFLLPRDASLLL